MDDEMLIDMYDEVAALQFGLDTYRRAENREASTEILELLCQSAVTLSKRLQSLLQAEIAKS